MEQRAQGAASTTYWCLCACLTMSLCVIFVSAWQGPTTQYVYGVDGSFVFSGNASPHVVVNCSMVPNFPPGTDCGSGEGALLVLAAMDF